MMDDKSADELELLWGALLSEDAEQVRKAYFSLQPTERQVLLVHLKRMASEEGWQPGQRRSAQAALDALDQV